MDLHSNLSIFYQTSPHFGGNLTSFVAILAQNTCVLDCRPVLCYFKVNVSLLERFMKPGTGIIDGCLLQHHSFISNSPIFGGKLTSFVAVLAQNTCVCGCRPGLYYSKVNIGWLERFMKPGMGIMDNFPVQPHHFLQSQPSFWRKMDVFCGCCGPKHMCVWL